MNVKSSQELDIDTLSNMSLPRWQFSFNCNLYILPNSTGFSFLWESLIVECYKSDSTDSQFLRLRIIWIQEPLQDGTRMFISNISVFVQEYYILRRRSARA